MTGEYRKIINHYHAGKRPPLFVNVPPLPTHALVGRDEMLSDLIQRLLSGQSPALSTAGMPGVGKTALAVALAHHPDVQAHFADGILWGGLGTRPDVPGIQAAWATALGTDISTIADPAQRTTAISNVIGQRRMLAVLDDAWELEAAQILRPSGNVCCLLTTRDEGIARKFASAAQSIHVPTLEEDPSLQLLRALAPKACDADPEAVAELAQSVDGLPLALELLGGYLAEPERHLFPDLSQQAFEEMSDPCRRLTLAKARLGGRLDQKQSLAATIQLSLDQLAGSRPEAVEVFHALGAFAPKPARFDRVAAEAVTGADGVILSLLIARNLLELDADKSLALHQTLVDYATQEMPKAARVAHRDHFLALVNEDREDWQRIEIVYPQVLHAWNQQIIADPEDIILISFADGLDTYQRRRGLWQDHLAWLEAALHFAETLQNKREIGRLLNSLGLAYSNLGELKHALSYHQKALSFSRQVGNSADVAAALNNIGAVYSDIGDHHNAVSYSQEALQLLGQENDREDRATTLNNIGQSYSSLGEKSRAMRYYQKALSLYDQVGSLQGKALVQDNIGQVYFDLNKPSKALELHRAALLLYRQTGDLGGTARALNNCGLVYSALGEKQKSHDHYKDALMLRRRLGDRRGEATVLTGIGFLYNDLGEHQLSLEYHHQALVLSRQVGDRNSEAAILNNIGGTHVAQGDTQQALNYFSQAVDILSAICDPWHEATGRANIGYLNFELNEWDRAETQLVQAVEIAGEIGHPALAQYQELLARVRAKRGG